MRKLVKSCKKCVNNCCIFGPGPHKTVPVDKFLENYTMIDGYNTKCENLTKDNKCKLWGTPKLPIGCRTFVCQNKEFSVEEINIIKRIDDYLSCPKCGCEWRIDRGGRHYLRECEVCGYMDRWKKEIIKESRNEKSK